MWGDKHNMKQNNQSVSHQWESLWACTLGQYVCKTCGLPPKKCKGQIIVRRNG